MMFVDVNHDGRIDAGEPVLGIEGRAPPGITITANRPLDDYVSYTSIGHARMLNGALQMGTFTVCQPRPARAARGSRQQRPRAHGAGRPSSVRDSSGWRFIGAARIPDSDATASLRRPSPKNANVIASGAFAANHDGKPVSVRSRRGPVSRDRLPRATWPP